MVDAEDNSHQNGNGADKGEKNPNLEPEQFRKMFIGGLTLNTTEDILREFYGKWGNLVDVVVMRDPLSKRSRGFGFVSYSNQAEVDAAMSNRPHVIDNKTVDPKRAVPREQSTRTEANISSKRLYVSGVREEHTEDSFMKYFGQFGSVVKSEIICDKNTGKPRGFAFITFDDYDAVDKCVLQKSHMINEFRCDVKKALSKEEMNKAQQHERERADRGNRSRGNGRGQWGNQPGRDGGNFGGQNSWGAGGGNGAWGPGGGPQNWGGQGGNRPQYGGSGGYGGPAGGYGGGAGGYNQGGNNSGGYGGGQGSWSGAGDGPGQNWGNWQPGSGAAAGGPTSGWQGGAGAGGWQGPQGGSGGPGNWNQGAAGGTGGWQGQGGRQY